MSTSLQSVSSSYIQGRPDASVATQPAARVAAPAAPVTQISEVAKEGFAKKAEVGADLQSLQKSIEASVDRLNAMMKDSGRDLNIGIDKALGGPVVTVRNAESGEVVRQIPNEVVVQMAHSIEAFKGWLHDDKA
jgi:flagellar protein FlaG